MARSQSNTVIKALGAGVAVVAGGAAFGFLVLGNVKDTHTAVQPAQPPVSATLPPRPAIAPSSIHPHTANGNYTAPGAPHITIEEESTPILRRTLPPAPHATDPEATQEATPIVTKPATKDADTSDTTQTDTGTASDTTPATPKSDTNTGAPGAQAAPAPSPPPPAPADPDFERVNTPKSAPSADPESGQQSGTKATTDAGKVQFRVQTGAYADESNARSVADTLRGEGYSTSTRSERDGDHLVYKVQVGAYRSKNGANKAADDLQKKGYPAFISSIGP